jgi:hypothetical protein
MLRTAGAAVTYLLVGVGSAVVGLLPWLVTGMRLPVQNLWAVNTLPEKMPITLLPFSQYELALIVAVIVTGSAIAGGFARGARVRKARFGLIAIAIGVLAVQAIATVQTSVTVSNGLSNSTASSVYLAALSAGSVAAIVIGLLVLLLIARAPRAGVAIAVSIAAVASSPWMTRIALPVGIVANESTMALLNAVRWVAPVIVGLVLAWCGLGTIGRVAAAIVSFLVLWIGPAAITAVTAAAGTRVLAPYPAEMAEYAAQVFVGALGPPGGSLSLFAVATVVMVLGLGVRWAIRLRRAAAAGSPGSTPLI